VHRAALAAGIAAAPSGELGHDAVGAHAAGQHVAVVAIAGDELVTLHHRHLHADDDRFLADVEVAEAADQAHAVHLAGLFLEAADEQHHPVGVEFFFPGEGRRAHILRGLALGRFGRSHRILPRDRQRPIGRRGA
jgi:hypothetical protein